PEHRIVAQDVEQPDDAHLARVMQDAHPLGRQQIAADAEGLQRGIELLELADDFGGVEVARGFAGDDGQLHRSGNGYITHPSAMAPKNSPRNTFTKKTIRSRRVCFHSSAK